MSESLPTPLARRSQLDPSAPHFPSHFHDKHAFPNTRSFLAEMQLWSLLVVDPVSGGFPEIVVRLKGLDHGVEVGVVSLVLRTSGPKRTGHG